MSDERCQLTKEADYGARNQKDVGNVFEGVFEEKKGSKENVDQILQGIVNGTMPVTQSRDIANLAIVSFSLLEAWPLFPLEHDEEDRK